MTPWLLLDYGEVLSLPYDDTSLTEIANRLDLAPALLRERYWAHRIDFDAGREAMEYWSDVAGRPVADAELADLVRIDCRGWARLDPAMQDLLDQQLAADTRLALLSNAPHFQADAFDELAWTDRFEEVFVSARLGLTKPDPAIFRHVLDVLAARPEDVTFVDDRRENVTTAKQLGLRAILFRGIDDLRLHL